MELRIVVNKLCYEIYHHADLWSLVLCNYSAHEDDTYWLADFDSEEQAIAARDIMIKAHRSILPEEK